MLADDLDVLAWAHSLQGRGMNWSVDAPSTVAHRGALCTYLRRHPVDLGHGREYLTCWLETELIIDIKRELALLRQMLPDARITGSMLLPRWIWVGARKETAFDKFRKVVNHQVASMVRFLQGRAYLRMP